MLSRIFVIILLCCIALPAVAGAAGLTFGAAPGSTRSLETENQARRLVADLADALDEDLKVRLFNDQEQIGQWLNQFAMLDLAVMDEAFLSRHPGEFLVLGPVEHGSALFIVTRQGATGNLPQRIVRILRRDGGIRITPAVAPPPAVVETPRRRAEAASPATPLVLGCVTGRVAAFASAAEAEQFAARLGERLGTPVRARLFDSEQSLADWFLRFRMIDLAIITETGRRDPLVGDYRQLERLPVTGGSSGLLVARRDLPPMRLEEMLQSLATSARAASREEAPVAPVLEPSVAKVPFVPSVPVLPPPPAVPPAKPPMVAVVPVPAPPEPAASPVWPETPPVLPAPEMPVVEPAPLLPTLPPVLPVEEPTLPGAAEPVAILPPEPVSPAEVPALLVVAPFEMPTSIGPVGGAGESRETGTLPVSGPIEVLPEVAVPVAAPPTVIPEPPVPAPVVVDAPAPDVPAAPEPPPAAAVTETTPAPLPELPFTPVPPQMIEEPAVPVGAETAGVAPVETETVPVVTVAPAEPVSIPPEEARPPAVSAELAGLPFVPVPPQMIEEHPAAEPAPAAEESLLALAGADKVPDIIAQPDLPQELRPPGVPLPRPGRAAKGAPPVEEPLLLAKLEKPLGVTPKPPPLLPEPDAEPGIVYVAPFITLMVPNEVRERIFDQFIDTLNQRGAAQKLKFVILKQGLDKIDRAWLAARKYALGEIYGYVEDSGCCSTDLRTRVRLTFYRAHQPEPVLKFEYPIRTFFDHDRSTLAVERQKLADQIAAVLVDEMFKALRP